MLRKSCYVFILASVLLIFASQSFAAQRKQKYSGPLLTGCRIYQLGENEFILKLSGRKLSRPKYDTAGESLTVTLYDTIAEKPSAINAALLSTIEGSPLIYECLVRNVSDDASRKVEIGLKSNLPLSVNSSQNSYEGWNIRVKSQKPHDLIPGQAYLPPPRRYPSPMSSLPFSVNQKVTLELRDAELRDVVRGLMSYLDRNVILDSTFPGNVLVTMTLVDVRIDEILNYFMRTYDLAAYNAGANTTIFGTYEGLSRLSGAKSLKSFHIAFADPAKISGMLRSIAGLEENSVTVDERMRTLYVSANPVKMQEVEDLITLLDVPQKQVMIQASIFEFSDSDSLAVQAALDIAYDDIRLSLGGTTGLAVDYQQDRSVKGPRTIRTARTIQATLSALETKSKGKVLANPSVIATDGKQATITLTQDYPYVSSRNKDDGTVTWSTEEVGPKLTFTPQIGRDGYVTLALDISTGDVVDQQTSSTGEQMPITTTRQVTTEVRVRDGMPFVIGGLFRDDTSRNVSRIPVLGNIPLLGELFTYRYNSRTKSQVVMVITPYILDSN